MRRSQQTRFYFFIRAPGRSRPSASVLQEMSALENVRAWFSCDRDTGLPRRVPAGVRLAWLMTSRDVSAARVPTSIFRVSRLALPSASGRPGVAELAGLWSVRPRTALQGAGRPVTAAPCAGSRCSLAPNPVVSP